MQIISRRACASRTYVAFPRTAARAAAGSASDGAPERPGGRARDGGQKNRIEAALKKADTAAEKAESAIRKLDQLPSANPSPVRLPLPWRWYWG